MDEKIKLEHGAGGEIMEELLRDVILKTLTLKSAGGIGLMPSTTEPQYPLETSTSSSR